MALVQIFALLLLTFAPIRANNIEIDAKDQEILSRCFESEHLKFTPETAGSPIPRDRMICIQACIFRSKGYLNSDGSFNFLDDNAHSFSPKVVNRLSSCKVAAGTDDCEYFKCIARVGELAEVVEGIRDNIFIRLLSAIMQ